MTLLQTIHPLAANKRPRLVRAEGCHVWDSEGRRYLDATSGAFCVQLGYSRPDLVRAMTRAAETLPHARPTEFENEEAEHYRRELLAAAGAPYARVLFTSSGSEAVDVALKIAHRYQVRAGRADRTGVIHLDGHYHGATLGALGVTGWEPRREPYAGLLGPGTRGPAAFCRRCFRSLTHPSCRVACADAAVQSPPAALIQETIPAVGLGAPVPPPGYLARMRTLCHGAGAVWIVDEVLTGFGRTGDLFAWKRIAARADDTGATLDRQAVPDLVVFGKGAGAGYAALAGVLVAERIARALEPQGFEHFQTYAGNPIAAAVGRRVLEAMSEEKIDAQVRAREAGFKAVLESLLDLPSVYDVRGMGFLWAVELAEAKETGRPFPRERAVSRKVADACRERGVLVHAGTGSAGGANGDFLLLTPPLVADDGALLEIASVMRESIETTLHG
jgi:adenosylmethionine-8-amino-7-oxononanoate aminotransferase